MAATAVVARRIGEKNPEAASKAGMQTGVYISIPVAEIGLTIAAYVLFKKGKLKTKKVEGD